MANFLLAYKFTAGIEKGYTVDNGGPTYAGISFKAWLSDPIARKIKAIVEAARPAKGSVIKSAALDELIISFYKKNYWDKIHGDEIKNQTLANLVYDFSLNSGSGIAIINEAIGGRKTAYINETSLKALNERPAFCYLAIKKARLNLYNKLAAKNPKFKTNNTYNGWMARLNLFPKELTA